MCNLTGAFYICNEFCVKVRQAAIEYIQEMALAMEPSDLVNSESTKQVIIRVVTWASDPRSSDIRKVHNGSLDCCCDNRVISNIKDSIFSLYNVIIPFWIPRRFVIHQWIMLCVGLSRCHRRLLQSEHSGVLVSSINSSQISSCERVISFLMLLCSCLHKEFRKCCLHSTFSR